MRNVFIITHLVKKSLLTKLLVDAAGYSSSTADRCFSLPPSCCVAEERKNGTAYILPTIPTTLSTRFMCIQICLPSLPSDYARCCHTINITQQRIHSRRRTGVPSPARRKNQENWRHAASLCSPSRNRLKEGPEPRSTAWDAAASSGACSARPCVASLSGPPSSIQSPLAAAVCGGWPGRVSPFPPESPNGARARPPAAFRQQP